MNLSPSELILNEDGSIYHLNLLPEDLAHKIIFVGDPDRVETVSCFFDEVRVRKQKREFITHTGSYQGKEISVISTGIGTDNIDIVLNELDALVNIDLPSRTQKNKLTPLEIIRIGTSGSIREEIELDTILASEYAIGMDGMMNYYNYENREDEQSLYMEFSDYLMDAEIELNMPYCFGAHTNLLKKFSELQKGITLTQNGFYGAQGRFLRAQPIIPNYIDFIRSFQCSFGKITNLEMETAGIYGLSSLLGHKAISLNLIVANRVKSSFSNNIHSKLNELIEMVLQRI